MRLFILTTFLFNYLFSSNLPSNYYEIKDTNQMKQYFFKFINEMAVKQNKLILNDRNFIKDYYLAEKQNNQDLVKSKRFEAITKRYKLKEKASLEDYLARIDIIPISIVLSQAVVESGWGKSRFFREAKNIFGQWTWTGKGLIPKGRDGKLKHKIRIFNSYIHSVKGYMINLNLGHAYVSFRKTRAKLRLNDSPIMGLLLVDTLANYSQKREIYTKLLKKIILKNKLERFDK